MKLNSEGFETPAWKGVDWRVGDQPNAPLGSFSLDFCLEGVKRSLRGGDERVTGLLPS